MTYASVLTKFRITRLMNTTGAKPSTGQKVKFPALQKTYSGCPSEVSCTFFVHALMKYTAQFLRLVGSEISCTFFVHALMKYTAQFLRLVDRSYVIHILCTHET